MDVPPGAVRLLPQAPGVYRFRDGRGRVIYLGRATNLRSRVASYWGPLRGRRHLARMVVQIERLEAVECDPQHEAAWLELLLMQRSKPRWNRMFGFRRRPSSPDAAATPDVVNPSVEISSTTTQVVPVSFRDRERIFYS